MEDNIAREAGRVDIMDRGREEAVPILAATSVQVGIMKMTLLLRVPVLLLPVQMRRHPAVGHAGNKVSGPSSTFIFRLPTR